MTALCHSPLQRLSHFLIQNEADDFLFVLPPLASLGLGRLYTQHQTIEYGWLWCLSVGGIMLLAGTWRACRRDGMFSPLVAEIFGASIGFAAGAAPVSAFPASLGPSAPQIFTIFTLLGIYAYGGPAILLAPVHHLRKVGIAAPHVIMRRLKVIVVALAMASAFAPLLTTVIAR